MLIPIPSPPRSPDSNCGDETIKIPRSDFIPFQILLGGGDQFEVSVKKVGDHFPAGPFTS